MGGVPLAENKGLVALTVGAQQTMAKLANKSDASPNILKHFALSVFLSEKELLSLGLPRQRYYSVNQSANKISLSSCMCQVLSTL